MGLTGKRAVEMEIKSSADDYFHGWVNHGSLFSKALPDGLHKTEVNEGDGKSLDSIISDYYVLDGSTVASTKAKMEAIDEENKSITLNVHDGHVGELYSKYKLNAQVFTRDGKNFVNCTMDYEKLSEEVPEPFNYLELKTTFAKGLEVHLKAKEFNPNACYISDHSLLIHDCLFMGTCFCPSSEVCVS